MDNIKSDQTGVFHFVSLSGGKDSTAMALRLKELDANPYNFVCTPTGDELPEMIDHWAKLESILEQEIIQLKCPSLDEVIEKNKCLPNWQKRFCTRIIKIHPFMDMLFEHTPCISYVGLRFDEGERSGADLRGGDLVLESEVKQNFPLREWGWGLDEVLGYLESKNVTIPQRTDCARCFYQTVGEWYSLWDNYPDIYQAAIDDEEKYGHTYRSRNKEKISSVGGDLLDSEFSFEASWRDSWPASLKDMAVLFERGYRPRKSNRVDMCRTCSL